MTSFIPFTYPDITELELKAVDETLRSGWLTTGTKVKAFEEQFAKAVGGRYAVAVNSCTAALLLALEAAGVDASHEVIIPTMTFSATAEAICHLGARPVLVDVRPENHTIDPEAIRRAITSRTKAIIPVHLGGQACEMEVICNLAREHKIQVIEDAAHAFPSSYRGQRIGSIGDLTCFSFYATKPLTTGEGGMVVTNNEQLAHRIRLMSLHGISKNSGEWPAEEAPWDYRVMDLGYKYNMTDIAAAMGIVQLNRTEEMLEKRRLIASSYIRDLGTLGSIELLEVQNFKENSWHLFIMRLRQGALSIGRNQFIHELYLRGIGASVHYKPLHCHPYYERKYLYRAEDFPVSMDLYERSISLPIFSKMDDLEIHRVIQAVLDIARIFRQ